MMYELQPYNGKKFGPGWYSVADKLIRQAAKMAKGSAPNILCELHWLNECQDEAMDQLVMIWKTGTCLCPVNNGIVELYSFDDMPLRCWRVRSDGKEMWTERVTLREVK